MARPEAGPSGRVQSGRGRWPAAGSIDLERALPVAGCIALLGYATFKAIVWALNWAIVEDLINLADHAIYMNQAHRVLAGGPLYNPWQLAGPYGLDRLPELYPPLTVYLLIVPMSFLPDPVWWIAPLGIIAAVVARWRPERWAWLAILTCFLVPRTWTSIAAGNPAMWCAAGVALGTAWGWPAVFAVLKPTLAPFALIGIRRRSWWLAAGILAGLSLLMIPGWIDYLAVVRNNADGTLLYGLVNAPLMAIPIIAWAGSRRVVRPRWLASRFGRWSEAAIFGPLAIAVALALWQVQ